MPENFPGSGDSINVNALRYHSEDFVSVIALAAAGIVDRSRSGMAQRGDSNVRMSKLDLVAWLADGRLYHLELQSGNDPEMAQRMLEYYLFLWRWYGVIPVQQLIYVGRRPLAMSAEIQRDKLTFHYSIIDMRELDSEPFLESPAIEDNLLAILCHLNDKRSVVRRILARIEQLPAPQRLNSHVAASAIIGTTRSCDMMPHFANSLK
jgi:hypothetical protein